MTADTWMFTRQEWKQAMAFGRFVQEGYRKRGIRSAHEYTDLPIAMGMARLSECAACRLLGLPDPKVSFEPDPGWDLEYHGQRVNVRWRKGGDDPGVQVMFPKTQMLKVELGVVPVLAVSTDPYVIKMIGGTFTFMEDSDWVERVIAGNLVRSKALAAKHLIPWKDFVAALQGVLPSER